MVRQPSQSDKSAARQILRVWLAAAGSTESERREADLVLRYAECLRRQSHEVGRAEIHIEGRVSAVYSDLFDQTTRNSSKPRGRRLVTTYG
jgi:hypothetical protein